MIKININILCKAIIIIICFSAIGYGIGLWMDKQYWKTQYYKEAVHYLKND